LLDAGQGGEGFEGVRGGGLGVVAGAEGVGAAEDEQAAAGVADEVVEDGYGVCGECVGGGFEAV